jgi:hypothetical protein
MSPIDDLKITLQLMVLNTQQRVKAGAIIATMHLE